MALDETPGVVTTPAPTALYGRRGNYLFFDTSLVWVERVGNEVRLEKTNSPVTREGNYVRVET